MDWQTWGTAAVGGAMIGGSAGALLALTGKTAGISGILDGLVSLEKSELGWKAAFVLGLIAGGIGLLLFMPQSLAEDALRAWPAMLLAGLLVGFGTRMGGGCTSGHGVCGIGRLSMRSIVGTIVFIAVGALTVILMRQIGEGV